MFFVGINGWTFKWVASTSCSTASCKQTQGILYNPSGSRPTDAQPFKIQYLSGMSSGPIVWESVTLGGYEIGSQAMGVFYSISSNVFYRRLTITSCSVSRRKRRGKRTSWAQVQRYFRPGTPTKLNHRSDYQASNWKCPRRRSMGIESVFHHTCFASASRSVSLAIPRSPRL